MTEKEHAAKIKDLAHQLSQATRDAAHECGLCTNIEFRTLTIGSGWGVITDRLEIRRRALEEVF